MLIRPDCFHYELASHVVCHHHASQSQCRSLVLRKAGQPRVSSRIELKWRRLLLEDVGAFLKDTHTGVDYVAIIQGTGM